MSIFTALRLSRAPVFAFVSVGLTWGCVAAMAPVIKARIGVDDATFGLLLLGTAMGLTTTLWVAPRWDRGMGSWAMPAGAVILAGAATLPGQATTALGLFLILTLLGGLSGLLDVVMNARVSEIEARSGRSLMNLNHGMFSVAYAVSALLTGAMREAGWSPEAIFATIAGLILLSSTAQYMPLPRSEEGEGAEATAGLPHRIVVVTGAIVLIAFMTEATVESWSALHIERTLGGGAAEGAFGPATLGMTMALGRFSGQAVAARLSEITVIRIAALLTGVGVLIAAAAPTPAVAYLGFGLLGLGVSVIGPMGLALAGRLARRSQRTAVIARVAIIGFVGFFIAPASMGVGAEILGLRWAFAAVALLLLGLWPLTRRARQMDRSPQSEEAQSG